MLARVWQKTLAMDRFDFQAVIPALHHRAVVTVALDAHARDQPMRLEHSTTLARTVLAANVA